MKKWIILTVACLIPAACGPGLIYPNLDRLIPMAVGDYISLDDRQDDLLNTRLADQLDWHRRVQLPVYADLLQEMARDFSGTGQPVTPDRLAAYLSRMKACWLELRIRLGPDIADVLSSATDAQLDELFGVLDRKNRKLQRKYLDAPAEEVLRRREKRMLKYLAYWIGDPTPAQEAAAAEWAGSLEPGAEAWLKDRRRVQEAFRDLLAHRHENPRFASDFTDLLISYDRTRAPEYQARIDADTARPLAFLARLDRMLTPDQRARLLDRIASFSRTFERLAGKPEPSASRPVASRR